MLFPDFPRVVYEKNPLKEVICQLAFPSILRVDSEPPVKFQEAIRAQYPIYKEEQTTNIRFNFPTEAQAQNPLLLRGGNAYRFSSEDLNWTISCTRDFIALSTTQYTRWEDFKGHFQDPLSKFIKEYAPPFFTRVGLRYVDIINRHELGLDSEPWHELLSPYIAGELSYPEIADHVLSCANQLIIGVGQSGAKILLNHGLVSNKGNNPADFSYLIDCDFSTEQKTEIADVYNRIDDFNGYSRRLFRWCIKDKVHDALHPQPL